MSEPDWRDDARRLAERCESFAKAVRDYDANPGESYHLERLRMGLFSIYDGSRRIRRRWKGAADGDDHKDLADYSGESAERMAEWMRLLPAWLTARIGGDTWFFGLLMTTGHVLAVESITNVRMGADGTVWLDAWLVPEGWTPARGIDGAPLVTSPTDRTTATINAAHIVAAMELADT